MRFIEYLNDGLSQQTQRGRSRQNAPDHDLVQPASDVRIDVRKRIVRDEKQKKDDE